MRFAFVLFSYFPYGGLQQDMVKILNACRQRKVEVTIYCMDWEGEIPLGAKVVLLSGQGITRVARREWFVEQMLEATVNKYDLVIGFNRMPGLDFYYGADYCFAAKAYDHRNFLYRLTARAKQYLEYETAVFGKDEDTICLLLSPSQVKEFRSYYHTPKDRLIMLPPGIKMDRRAGPDATAKRMVLRYELGISQDDFLILQIGSAFKTKGLDRSLRAYASLPKELRKRCHFYVVGEDAPEKYLAMAERLEVQKHFRILNGRSDIPEFLQAADLLIHPSVRESAGMVILEAIVAGLPVLTTDTCGYAFHVEKAEAGMVCPSPFEQETLNKNLLEMISGNELETWKKNGIAYGQQHDLYSMPQTVAALLVQTASSYQEIA